MASPAPPATVHEPLDISDLIRPSLSPSPKPTSHSSRHGTPTSPGPFGPEELQAMKDAVLAMNIVSVDCGLAAGGIPTRAGFDASTTSDVKEKRLAQMVLRLTQATMPLPQQLVEQAETISSLSQQRDLLVSRFSEEGERRGAEQDGWLRMVGALAERSMRDITVRADDLERENGQLNADNRMMKMRLQETRARLASLEAELISLRPLLILPDRTPPTHIPTPSRPPGRPRKIKERVREKGRDKNLKQSFSDEEIDGATLNHDPLRLPTLGDARIEHLLLAAKRIGKQRVARLAPVDPTTTTEQASSNHPITPRTPRVRSTAPNTMTATRGRLPLPTPSPAQTPLDALVSSSPTRNSRTTHRNYDGHLAQLPRRYDSTPAAPPSGLESLLSAARSVLDPVSHEGSPSKRRRIDSEPDCGARSEVPRSHHTGQAMSALDVLADQAVAFGSHSDSTSAESATSPPEPTRLARGVTFPSLDTARSRIDPRGQSRARGGLERSSTEPHTPRTLGPAFTLRTSTSDTTPKPSFNVLQPTIAALSDPPSPMGPPQSSSPLQSRHTPGDFPATPRPMRGQGPSTSSDAPSSATSSHGPSGDTLARISGEMSSKRPRSPYVKWTKEEDDLLSKAVQKFGQKWDLVQKALPSRGYHQVRQRWLRKLGPSINSSALFDQNQSRSVAGSSPESIPPGPKLGLAPLSSEKAFHNSLSSSLL